MTTRTQKLKDAIPDAPPPGDATPGQKVAIRKPDPAGDLLSSMEEEFRKCLPEVLPWDMFARVALTGFRKTPELVECTRPSLLGALMECARLGLAPCTDQAWLLPFKNTRRQVKECQLVVGYPGYIELMYRSGQVEQVVAEIVYEADEWEYSLGDGGRFWHKPNITLSKEKRGAPLFAYSYASLLSGGRTRVATINHEEALELKAKHGVKLSSPWRTNFEAMWLKTPVRRIQKWAPKSPELRRAYAVDGATLDLGGITANPDDEGVLDGEVVTEVAAPEAESQAPDPQAWDSVEVAQPPDGER